MAKEFLFKGLSWEELLGAQDSKLQLVLTSRGRRTLKRGIKLDKRILKAIDENAKGKTEVSVKTHKRDLLILPNMAGLKFFVYNGKSFQPVIITKEMVGFYLGEFVDTRLRPKHSKAGIGATKSSKHIAKK